ncbi:MAG: hypothetical protein NTW29_02370 [Bacteroidetes bacterium]|nr:hypothetical protein [Bacteroidota bacterium]
MATPNPQRVYEALLNGNKDLFLLDNLISTGKAVFCFLRAADLDDEMKYAFFELEKRFHFYASLLEE